ncbi:hypothetical protein PSN45_002974 [Yamadazyma tenuis]|uniref:Gamma-glutamyltransferase n=1 Tax=Candida tenuis (strain ATCC 10573 / BCRC 21748 / CBS 615 / JCM 9827 / NBRC 10315 / NRRL Y-1498 / VKM Y-70) TaxID=590646 RepID=G3AW13_CANTC|nr:gamma-glutamyltransferase [Yamadazyma tenuis ATCC 10573]EGV66425.1 gamma-glutamyltransferase [Yamadazyma tenuis ATCC 10573]WEJ95455.1 hypothetical protein PSN45_002974 [Yamadazyma tenuis]
MSTEFSKFASRRSTVYSTKGMVASSQPAANAAGLKILSKGGNCVDACIALAAALCITEPGSTGIGGDCFALYYKNSTKEVLGLNGCGRAAKNLTIQDVWDELNEGKSMARIPYTSAFAINVPGAIAGWFDAYESWGSGNVSFEEILEPAIELADKGFAVCEMAARSWRNSTPKIIKSNPNLEPQDIPVLINGKGPDEGDFVTNKSIAKALEIIGEKGKKGFYTGPVAKAIINQTDSRHHKLTLEDLEAHTSTFVEPIQYDFFGYTIWEIPPNGQGLVALVALGVIQELHKAGKIDVFQLEHNSSEYLHLLIETLKIGFYEANDSVTDPEFKDIPVSKILSSEYLEKKSQLFSKDKIINSSMFGVPIPDPKFKTDTTYFTASDANGDACSFINSVYQGFGGGICVPEYGFCLHNRGANFNLTPGATNCLEGGKRPYHTIIPSMITKKGELFASFGNMGGYMQPIGHVLHVMNLCVFGFTPQQSVDSPRFLLDADTSTPDSGLGGDGPVSTNVTNVLIEEGISEETYQKLTKLGHRTSWVRDNARTTFGRAQIIKNESKNGHLIYAAGSEIRADGAAIPFL